MDIEFLNLKKVCNKLEIFYENYDKTKPIYQCKHSKNKKIKCDEEVCPINNKNYWTEVKDVTLIVDGKAIVLGNGKISYK
ncbi:hypothetical protein [Romboutsia lituseburensis]|uniref:hypothetical protein n=1 Tax=Romboutsia lituseburensis TaxID=1537 RepID=UPI0022EB9680|nr:hypothetical protein [Romboutsia lituseburensis]